MTDEAFEEYTNRYKMHLQLLNTSFKIFRDCYNELNDTRLENVIKFVEDSAKLINCPDNDWYKIRHRWRRMNDLMVQGSESVELVKTVLSTKRSRCTGTSFNSLYVFLQCEDVESLDELWNEYKSGKLLLEIAEQKNMPSGIAVTIDERNYRAYRKCLGESNDVVYS